MISLRGKTIVEKSNIDLEKHIKQLKDIKPFLNDDDVEEYMRIREDSDKPRFKELKIWQHSAS